MKTGHRQQQITIARLINLVTIKERWSKLEVSFGCEADTKGMIMESEHFIVIGVNFRTVKQIDLDIVIPTSQ